jgi:hypothetical protein
MSHVKMPPAEELIDEVRHGGENGWAWEAMIWAFTGLDKDQQVAVIDAHTPGGHRVGMTINGLPVRFSDVVKRLIDSYSQSTADAAKELVKERAGALNEMLSKMSDISTRAERYLMQELHAAIPEVTVDEMIAYGTADLYQVLIVDHDFSITHGIYSTKEKALKMARSLKSGTEWLIKWHMVDTPSHSGGQCIWSSGADADPSGFEARKYLSQWRDGIPPRQADLND